MKAMKAMKAMTLLGIFSQVSSYDVNEPWFPAGGPRPAHTPRNQGLSNMLVSSAVSIGLGHRQTADRVHKIHLEVVAHNILEVRSNNLAADTDADAGAGAVDAVDGAADVPGAELMLSGRHGHWMLVAG